MGKFSSGSRDAFDENQQMHSIKNRMHSMKSQYFCVFSKAQNEYANAFGYKDWHPCTCEFKCNQTDGYGMMISLMNCRNLAVFSRVFNVSMRSTCTVGTVHVSTSSVDRVDC